MFKALDKNGDGAITLDEVEAWMKDAPPGTPGGPPLPQDQRILLGMPVDLRALAINMERHPEQLRQEIPLLLRKLQEQRK